MGRRGSGERAREMAEMAEVIRFLFLILFLWKEGIGGGRATSVPAKKFAHLRFNLHDF